MLRDFVPNDDTRSQNLGSPEKPWNRGYVDTLAAPDASGVILRETPVNDIARDSVVQAAIAEEADARAAAKAELAQALSNEIAAREAECARLSEELAILKGGTTYLAAYNFNTTSPAQDALTTYALQQTGWDSVRHGTSIVNLTDGHEWIYDLSLGRWVNFGQTSVTQATNSQLGIVRGSVAMGKVSVNSMGEMVPNGFALLTSPAFTGTPTAPTPAATDSSAKIATTEFVKERIAEVDTGGSSDAPLKPTASYWLMKTATAGSSGLSSTFYKYVLPTGGTWAYFIPHLYKAGVAAGGTTIVGDNVTTTNQAFLCWRVS